MASWKGFGKGLLKVGKQIPVVGNVLEGVAPTETPKYDFGADDYYAPQSRANILFGEGLRRADREYTPGRIGDYGPIRDQSVGPAERTRAYDAGPVETYRAGLVQNPRMAQVGGLAGVQAPEELRSDPAAAANAVTAGRTLFQRGQADESRGIQQEAVSGAREEAAGRGPGAGIARALFGQAIDEADQRALGIAESAPRAEQASLRRKALFDRGRNLGERARTTALLGLQAQQGGQRQLGELATQVRGQDIDVAGQQAQLDAEAETLNARLQTEMAAGNRDAVNMLQRQLNDLEARRREFQADSINTRTMEEAKFRTGVDERNIDRGLDVETGNIERMTDADKFRAESTNLRRDDYASRFDTAERTSADRGLDVRKSDADLARDADIRRAEGGFKVDTARDAAGRAAFDSTQTAQRGYLDSAGRAVSTEIDAVSGRSRAKEAETGVGLRSRDDERRSDAANREGIRAAYDTVVNKGGGRAAGDAAHGGLVFKKRKLTVGEAGPELIVPVKPDAARAYRDVLDLQRTPFTPSSHGGGLDEDDMLDLLGVVAEKSRRKREARS